MSFERQVVCPHCKTNNLDTVTSAPYIRGFLLAYTYGTKRFVGCNSCVKKQLLGEAGLSALIGWFSITSMLVNPMCILWNGLRAPFLSRNPAAVEKLFRELGVSPVEVDIPKVAAALAASMIAADGKIEQSEVQMAVGVGQRIVEGFSPEYLIHCVKNHSTLPSAAHMAGMLGNELSVEGKQVILKYLLAIAASDGEIDPSEVRLLEDVARAFGQPVPALEPAQ